MKIREFRGIGLTYGDKLVNAGVTMLSDLLTKGKTPSGRRDLAFRTGIEESKILKWVNQADLTRINGVGPVYSELFEASGVDTVNELKNRNPDNLMSKITEVNNLHRITASLPTPHQVEGFVNEARTLEPMVEY
ncbi:MAG: DUF4332 domain-containing protein [Bacteroidetes bacterium]|nr:MAG: DUF4332 domain-containing protein [Bacteroidota bacterium]REK00807.1 MAG: DUF4332 domain-containing protein [Bacteroidota bacterium]REK35294.1 MAG: DUF4332 domain-containing protein [Bacteroidota bacterium]REK48374.1 MAG: DUF4332 domain-containing protein [Bacteroidota bacterium]